MNHKRQDDQRSYHEPNVASLAHGFLFHYNLAQWLSGGVLHLRSLGRQFDSR